MAIADLPKLSTTSNKQEFSSQNALLGYRANSEPEAIKKLSQEFESIFLEIVLKSMRNTVQKSGLMDGGNGEEVFRSMLDTEYAKNMAHQGSTGLAETIEKQLLAARSGPSEPAPVSTSEGLKAYGRSSK